MKKTAIRMLVINLFSNNTSRQYLKKILTSIKCFPKTKYKSFWKKPLHIIYGCVSLRETKTDRLCMHFCVCVCVLCVCVRVRERGRQSRNACVYVGFAYSVCSSFYARRYNQTCVGSELYAVAYFGFRCRCRWNAYIALYAVTLQYML